MKNRDALFDKFRNLTEKDRSDFSLMLFGFMEHLENTNKSLDTNKFFGLVENRIKNKMIIL